MRSLLVVGAVLVFPVSSPAQEARPLAITGVTLIDGTGAAPMRGVTVVVTGNRITAVGPSSRVVPPREARVVNGSGTWLLPGLWDMHVHPDDPEVWHLNPAPAARDSFIPQFVKWGVTGVRDMAGSWEVIKDWRARIAAGTLLGPRIVAGGPLVDGPRPMWPGSVPVGDAESGRRAVDSLIGTGVDFIKVYSLLPREAYFGIAERARERGIPFVGHVPGGVGLLEAVEAGQRSQEHMIGMMRELSDQAAVAERTRALGDGASAADRRKAGTAAMIETYDSLRAAELFRVFAKNDIWVDPTMILRRRNAFFDPNDPDVAARLPDMPAYIRHWWTPEENIHLRNRTPESAASDQALYRHYQRMIRDMHREGVRLLTGTDTGGNPHLFPGWSTHEEMEELVRAGLTPMEAIQAATRNAAEFLGLADSLGTVEVGKVADFFLAEGDPVADIRNSRRVRLVVFDGKVVK